MAKDPAVEFEKIKTILLYALISGTIGYFFLNPGSKLIQTFTDSSTKPGVDTILSAFSFEGLATGYYFMSLSAIGGLVFGILSFRHTMFKRQALIDELTNIYNRRHFEDRLEEEVQRALRHKRPLSLIMIDIDHFKNYNDKNGHPAGDRLLQKLAALLREAKRDTDILARYGGEEFSIIVPETGHKGAGELAERIREVVEEYPFQHREKQPLGKLTISLGVADIPTHAQSKKELLDSADKALYNAKESGRNQVQIAEIEAKEK